MKNTKESGTAPSAKTSVPGWPRLLALLAVMGAGLASTASAQTYGLSNTWTVTGTNQNLDTSADNRGMCYYAPGNMVIVNNKTSHVIETYDGTLGASNGFVNNTGLVGGNFTLNKIGPGTDGFLYGANLTTAIAAGTYNLYRWTNFASAPSNVYTSTAGDALMANLSGKRIGDTWAITGGGLNTLMLAGINTPNNFALFSTTTGTNFTPTVLTVNGLPATDGSGVQFGIAFYTNNTFMVNVNGGSGALYLVRSPANFASLPSPVTATVIATNTGLPTVSWLDLSYNSTAGLLAVHENAATPIILYSLPSTNFFGLASLASTNLSFSANTTINGNETGDVALGGVGLSNAIYTLETSSGVQATAITFTAAPIPPTIGTAPAGSTVYTNIGFYTFTVSATGTLPLHYQWQYNTVSNLATASNIPGATNSSLTISPLMVSNTGWYDVAINNAGGATNSIPVLLTVQSPIINPIVTNIWNVAPGEAGYPYIDSTSYDTRGIAYDTNTETVLVCDKNGSNPAIYVLDAVAGTNMFQLATTGIDITGDQFPLDQVGVADDGVVYACNLYDTGSTAGSFAINSWPSVSASAPLNFAYAPAADGFGGIGDPSAPGIQDRWGDTMAVRGGGVNTQILLGSYYGYLGGPATNAALFTTTQTGGTGFTSIPLIVTNIAVPAGFSSLGIAFGAGNTFWAKSDGYDLRQISFDPVTGYCSVIQDIPTAANGAAAFASMSAICLDVPDNILAGVTFNDVPNDLSIFVLGATVNASPYMFDQTFFPSFNGNVQDNGATTVKYDPTYNVHRIYSLDCNNGIVALTYGVPLVPFSITSVQDIVGTGVKLTWQSVATHSYQVQATAKLAGTTVWTNLGSPIVASGASTSYTDSSTNASLKAGYYQVVGQ